MTPPRPSRYVRHLALAACLGTALLALLMVTGSVTLLHTFERPTPGTSAPTGSFVCTSDEVGTLLLCEQSCDALPTSEIARWIAGNMKN